MADFPTTQPASRRAFPGDTGTATAGSDAVVTYPAAGVGVAHVVSQVNFSYSGSGTISASAPGNLTIKEGSNSFLDQDVAAAGLGPLYFSPPLEFSPNVALTITLTGIASLTGKLTVRHWTKQVIAVGMTPPNFALPNPLIAAL